MFYIDGEGFRHHRMVWFVIAGRGESEILNFLGNVWGCRDVCEGGISSVFDCPEHTKTKI